MHNFVFYVYPDIGVGCVYAYYETGSSSIRRIGTEFFVAKKNTNIRMKLQFRRHVPYVDVLLYTSNTHSYCLPCHLLYLSTHWLASALLVG
jgi:hypothetical protein